MFRKSVLPPKLSWYVRSRRTPRSMNRRVRTRWLIVAPTVMGHPPLHRDTGARDLVEHVRVVGLRVDRLGEVLADLVLVDVEGGHELDVADVVAADVHVHEARDELVVLGVPVVITALN